MSVNHEYETVEKEVVFSTGVPVTPYKIFTVVGDVLAFVLPVVKVVFDADAILAINEQNGSNLWSIETSRAESGERKYKVVSSDLYMNVIVDSPGVNQPVPVINTGTMMFYCVFASLSAGSSVEGA